MPSAQTRRRFDRTSLRFDDVEASESAIAEVYYPHTITPVAGGKPFEARLTLQNLGSVRVGVVDYNAALTLDCPVVAGSYHLDLPLAHPMRSTSRGTVAELTRTRGALYRRDADARLESGTPVRMCSVSFGSDDLERALAALIGRPVRDTIELAAALDVDRGLGKQWWELLTSVRLQMERGDSLLTNPLVAEPLAHALMSGFLLATEHQYSEELHAEASAGAPASVRLAEDLIMARLGDPLTVADLAAEVGVSVRALQRGFLATLDMTPSQYIRTQRLQRAHTDLVAGTPESTSVAEVAARWGFTHLGRFSAQYRALFGVAPSTTLRS